jgi:hypothetical protein
MRAKGPSPGAQSRQPEFLGVHVEAWGHIDEGHGRSSVRQLAKDVVDIKADIKTLNKLVTTVAVQDTRLAGFERRLERLEARAEQGR